MNRRRSSPATGGSARSCTARARSRKRPIIASTSSSSATKRSLSPVDAAPENRLVRADPIEEKQAVEVVELVEDSPGLEAVGPQDAVVAVRGDAADHDGG